MGFDLNMSDDRGELCPLCASLPLSEVPPNKAKALSDLWRVPERWSSLQQLECFLNPLLLLIQDSGTYTWMTKWPYCNIHGCSSWHLPWAGDHIDNQVEACCVLLLIWLLMSKLSVSPFLTCWCLPDGLLLWSFSTESILSGFLKLGKFEIELFINA